MCEKEDLVFNPIGDGQRKGSPQNPLRALTSRLFTVSSSSSAFHAHSGTFLQTLPDLVTPVKGHSLPRAAVHRRGQRPPKGSGIRMTVEAT